MPADLLPLPHQLVLDDRRRLTVSGVSDVDSFDDNTVVAHTNLGELTVRGHELHICRLNTESGELSLEGHIDALDYSDVQLKKDGFWRRWFR